MKKIITLIFVLFLLPTNVIAETKEVILDSCTSQADQFRLKTSEGFITTYQLYSIVSPSTNHLTKGEEPYSKEALEYACNRVKNASSIKLEEVETTITDHGEAYIFVDEALLQEELLKLGYAKISFLDENNPYYEVLAEAENKAKENKLGIWKEEEKTTDEKIEETIKEEIVSDTKKHSDNKKNTNPIMKIVHGLLDNLVAGINKMIDSILQKINNML